MKAVLREVGFFLLSCLSLILCLQSLPVHKEPEVDAGLAEEIRIQKDNHIDGRRKMTVEEKGLYTETPNNEKKLPCEEDRAVKKNEDSLTIPVTELKIRTENGDYIDLNQATAEELCGLKGVGPKLAERIIVYRKEIGVFMTLEDLLKVKGIGPKKFRQILNN